MANDYCELAVKKAKAVWASIELFRSVTTAQMFFFSIPDETAALLIFLFILFIGKWSDKSTYIIPLSCYTPRNEVRGGILDSPCLSVCPSVCLLPFRVRPVASTVQDGFFPYLVQMINSMRGCVACDDLWPWPISSRSFGLDLENRVRSVASTVLDGFFLYLAQMITIIRGCVACYVFFRNLEKRIFGKFLKFFGLDLEKKISSSRWILSIFSTNDH